MKKNLFLQMLFESQFLAEPMNKKDTAKVGQVAGSHREVQNSDSFGHRAQSVLFGRVLPEKFYC